MAVVVVAIVAAVEETATMVCTRDVAEGAVETTVTTEGDRTEARSDASTLPDQGVDLGLTDATTGMEGMEAITESRESEDSIALLQEGQDHRPDAGAREGSHECDDD
jgi:hypothetical protein